VVLAACPQTLGSKTGQEAERRIWNYEEAVNTWGSKKKVGKNDGWWYQFAGGLTHASFCRHHSKGEF